MLFRSMRGQVNVNSASKRQNSEGVSVEAEPSFIHRHSVKSLEIKDEPVLNAKQLFPGVLVKSTATEAQGEVLEVKKDKAWVAFGVIKMWVPIAELLLTKKPMGGRSEKTGQNGGFQWVERQSKYNPKIDVRGKRMEEATQEVLIWLEEIGRAHV